MSYLADRYSVEVEETATRDAVDVLLAERPDDHRGLVPHHPE